MSYHVYLLYSPFLDGFYVGYTESLTERVSQHNDGFYYESYTKLATDWELFYSIACETKKQAILIERHIKRMKSRKYYFSLKQYPDISIKLLKRYSES
ncbi:MAG: GIY-YIG nuclease family protein [Proteiniphilum sp.]|nr:GIY-YIG nuclease family protein [Proteiniphilum sp.]